MEQLDCRIMTLEIPQYERLRKKRVEENNRKLLELGLRAMATSIFKRPEDPGYVTLKSKVFPTDLLLLGMQVNNMLCL